MTHDPYFESLRREIAALAADADAQIRSVSAGLSFAALELQDIDHMLEVMLGERGQAVMSPDQLAVCRRLKEALTSIVTGESESSSFWTNDGVRNHPQWAVIRKLARAALSELDRRRDPLAPPQS